MSNNFIQKWLYPAGGLAYLAVLLASVLVALKPGAAIFYRKLPLEGQYFQHDTGSAYRYRLPLSPALFPPEKVLVFEDGHPLARVSDKNVIRGDGHYATFVSAEGSYYLYLAPTGNGNPASNHNTYQLYAAPFFLSQTAGLVISSILLFGVLQWIVFALHPLRRSRLHHIAGVWQSLQDFLAQIRLGATCLYTQAQIPWRQRLSAGRQLLVITAAAAYALILVEWLFQATKTSFMDRMSLGEKGGVFLLSGLALATTGMALVALAWLAGSLLRSLRLAWLADCAALAVPALLLTSLIVLWLDTFTYTLFHFGILTSSGLPRLAYGGMLVLLLLGFYLWMLRIGSRLGHTRPGSAFRLLEIVILGLVVTSSGLALFQHRSPGESGLNIQPPAGLPTFPNIILIGSDGVSATHLSFYEYERDTTPHIEQLAPISLVAENAFTNSRNTYGSLVSLLTSKLPARTRVLAYPDILQEADAYQHLPGILKKLGYTTVQIGVSHFADAYAANIQEGFDSVNQRSIRYDALVQSVHRLGYHAAGYFLLAIEERLANRLFQALHIDTIHNPFTNVMEPALWEDDRRRMDDLLVLLENSPTPLFVHVHLMGTHGPQFDPPQRIYSAGEQQEQTWMPDFYDDAIVAYDGYIDELVRFLKNSGQFENTLLILYSDHAMRAETNERIPMLFHFPGDQYKGEIHTNVQNLDIAPTILHYLGLPAPAWMEGNSVLRLPQDSRREPIFAIGTRAVEIEDNAQSDSPLPPTARLQSSNYQFSILQVLDCQRWYKLDVATLQWSSGEVSQYVSPCKEESLPSLAQARQDMIQYLAGLGLDTSSVP